MKNVKLFAKILIILITIFCTFLFISYFNINNYSNRKIIQTSIQCNDINTNLLQNNFIELEDLLVKVSNINYLPNENDEAITNNVLNFTIEFESKNNFNLISFDYIIFDNNNNILNTSVWNSSNNKNYIKGFVKEKYQTNKISELNEHILYDTLTFYDNITNNSKIYSRTLTSSLKESLIVPEQIYIRIFNINYSFQNSSTKSIQNTDLEFILKFQ